MKLLNLIAVFLLTLPLAAQQYALGDMNVSLLKEVNAVVREDRTVVTLEDFNALTFEREWVITILNEKAARMLDFVIYYDSYDSVKEYEAVVYDALGVERKKFKKRDFMDVSASGTNLYSDNRALVLDFTPTFYPCTVALTYSYKTSNTAFMPRFVPIPYSGISVEKASFRLLNKKGIPLHKKFLNFDENAIKVTESNQEILIEAKDLRPVSQQKMAPSFSEFLPIGKFYLEQFELQGVLAHIKDWDDFGKWQSQKLLKGLDVLPEQTLQKVAMLTEGIQDPKEKVKAIYQFMQDRTRYISVQVGIGGWKPSPAKEVDALGYGDCKGLTNYTRALLKSQGIDSYYTIVDSEFDGGDLDEDFVTLQGDHAILSVPFEDEMVFLECTNQDLPFGFLGTHTDDRKVLMITPEGGKMIRTPTYAAEGNLSKKKAQLKFDNTLQLSGTLEITSQNLAYYKVFGLEKLDEAQKQKYYKEQWDFHNGLQIHEIVLDHQKDEVSFVEKLEITSENYTTSAGDMLLLCPNVFTRITELPEPDEDRKYPLKIRRGYAYQDAVSIGLPEGYSVNSTYETVTMETEFGTYETRLEEKDGFLLYQRNLLLREGTWPKEKYNEYVAFLKAIHKKDKSKIVLKNNKS